MALVLQPWQLAEETASHSSTKDSKLRVARGALPPAAFDDLIQQVKGLDMEDVRRQIEEQNASEQ